MQLQSELPEGWICADMKDLFVWSNGKNLPKKNMREGNYLVYGGNGINGHHNKYLTSEECLVIGRVGANCGNVHLAHQKSWITDNAIYSSWASKNLYLKYFLILLSNHNLNELASGSGQPYISQKTLSSQIIMLPPLTEQHRIVSAIETLFARLDAANERLDRVPDFLKKFRQSVLAAACDGRLTEGWREENQGIGDGSKTIEKILEKRLETWKIKQKSKNKYKIPREVDTSDLPNLPKSWAWATLDQLVQEGRPIIYGIIKPGPNIPSGVPYVRVNEMANGEISNVSNLKRTSKEIAKKFARATLQSGDLLISKDGTIGKVTIVPPELEGGNINQHIVRASIHILIDRRFIVDSIRSPESQKWLEKEKKGVALQGVNVEDFRRLPLPVPPLPEQHEIVRRVDALFALADAIEAKVAAVRERTEKLRQSILAKAFSGELVPIEAELARQEGRDYEQADVLLERIKSEQGMSWKKGKAAKGKSTHRRE